MNLKDSIERLIEEVRQYQRDHGIGRFEACLAHLAEAARSELRSGTSVQTFPGPPRPCGEGANRPEAWIGQSVAQQG